MLHSNMSLCHVHRTGGQVECDGDDNRGGGDVRQVVPSGSKPPRLRGRHHDTPGIQGADSQVNSLIMVLAHCMCRSFANGAGRDRAGQGRGGGGQGDA